MIFYSNLTNVKINAPFSNEEKATGKKAFNIIGLEKDKLEERIKRNKKET